MLLMVEKGIRGGIYDFINRYATPNKKCLKDFDESKESSYHKCWDVNDSYVGTMS